MVWPRGASAAQINEIHGYPTESELKSCQAAFLSTERLEDFAGPIPTDERDDLIDAFDSSNRKLVSHKTPRRFVSRDTGNTWFPGPRIASPLFDMDNVKFIRVNLDLVEQLVKEIRRGMTNWTKSSRQAAADLADYYSRISDEQILREHPRLEQLDMWSMVLRNGLDRAPEQGRYAMSPFVSLPTSVQMWWRNEGFSEPHQQQNLGDMLKTLRPITRSWILKALPPHKPEQISADMVVEHIMSQDVSLPGEDETLPDIKVFEPFLLGDLPAELHMLLYATSEHLIDRSPSIGASDFQRIARGIEGLKSEQEVADLLHVPLSADLLRRVSLYRSLGCFRHNLDMWRFVRKTNEVFSTEKLVPWVHHIAAPDEILQGSGYAREQSVPAIRETLRPFLDDSAANNHPHSVLSVIACHLPSGTTAFRSHAAKEMAKYLSRNVKSTHISHWDRYVLKGGTEDDVAETLEDLEETLGYFDQADHHTFVHRKLAKIRRRMILLGMTTEPGLPIADRQWLLRLFRTLNRASKRTMELYVAPDSGVIRAESIMQRHGDFIRSRLEILGLQDLLPNEESVSPEPVSENLQAIASEAVQVLREGESQEAMATASSSPNVQAGETQSDTVENERSHKEDRPADIYTSLIESIQQFAEEMEDHDHELVLELKLMRTYVLLCQEEGRDVTDVAHELILRSSAYQRTENAYSAFEPSFPVITAEQKHCILSCIAKRRFQVAREVAVRLDALQEEMMFKRDDSFRYFAGKLDDISPISDTENKRQWRIRTAGCEGNQLKDGILEIRSVCTNAEYLNILDSLLKRVDTLDENDTYWRIGSDFSDLMRQIQIWPEAPTTPSLPLPVEREAFIRLAEDHEEEYPQDSRFAAIRTRIEQGDSDYSVGRIARELEVAYNETDDQSRAQQREKQKAERRERYGMLPLIEEAESLRNAVQDEDLEEYLDLIVDRITEATHPPAREPYEDTLAQIKSILKEDPANRQAAKRMTKAQQYALRYRINDSLRSTDSERLKALREDVEANKFSFRTGCRRFKETCRWEDAWWNADDRTFLEAPTARLKQEIKKQKKKKNRDVKFEMQELEQVRQAGDLLAVRNALIDLFLLFRFCKNLENVLPLATMEEVNEVWFRITDHIESYAKQGRTDLVRGCEAVRDRVTVGEISSASLQRKLRRVESAVISGPPDETSDAELDDDDEEEGDPAQTGAEGTGRMDIDAAES